MEINIRKYMADLMIGKRLHFKCKCLFPIDHIGTVKGYHIYDSEIVFDVDVNGRIVRVGTNHPNMNVSEVE